MNVPARLRKIEQKIFTQKRELMFVNEYKGFEGRYFIEQDGKDIEIKHPAETFLNRDVVIVKSCLQPNI